MRKATLLAAVSASCSRTPELLSLARRIIGAYSAGTYNCDAGMFFSKLNERQESGLLYRQRGNFSPLAKPPLKPFVPLAHDVNDFNLHSRIQLTIDNLDTASGGFIKSRIGEIPHSRRTAYPLILLS